MFETFYHLAFKDQWEDMRYRCAKILLVVSAIDDTPHEILVMTTMLNSICVIDIIIYIYFLEWNQVLHGMVLT